MKKLIVITGASSGFGKVLAEQFSAAGHPLLLLARRIELVEAMNLPNTMCKKVDVTNKADFESAVRQAEEKYGKTDLLINNAGVMMLGSLEEQDAAEWKTMLDTNVLGVMNGMQIVMANMKAQQCGTIINISSIAGVKAFGNHGAYCATKYGVVGLSEVAREELAPHNVRVITICPGAVATELLGHTTNPEIIKGYKEWINTVGATAITAEDVATTIKFAYDMPQSVCLRQIQLADTKQGV